MNIKLTCGSELLVAGWPGDIPPTVAQLLAAAGATRPEVVATWCDEQARLRESLPVSSTANTFATARGFRLN